jgi:hypothetical protein
VGGVSLGELESANQRIDQLEAVLKAADKLSDLLKQWSGFDGKGWLGPNDPWDRIERETNDALAAYREARETAR